MTSEASAIAPTTEDQLNTESARWKVNLLYDGECPLCLREVNFLKKKNAGRGIVKFTDIADLDYRPEENGGVDFETAMGRIHAVLADGTVIKNVEVFQRVYDALGIGWIYAPTKWPVIGPIIDGIYDRWADLRLFVTGRGSLNQVITEREESLSGQSCQTDRCQLDET
ncbi:DUF393 domain-containing protein [Leptolyngbya sp. BC1307]|uniref:thiol-disulfide oxidoreductase DCC family protein n=1 Tax=Leptolyngbya sp. BC1307 TaxID=2029589 RepID=UPI000EFBF40E|nr:DUF393 domain-containing protein [Leptolyngbya sp. BC1307]